MSLAEAAPAWADGPVWRRPAYGRIERFPDLSFRHRHVGRPVYRHGAFGPPRSVWRRHGFFARPVARVWGSSLPVAGLAAGYVSVGYAGPAWGAAAPPYAFASADPVCGSYAAPVGYHGVIYNRPLCPCY